jgi:Got1/Sft2-like family
MFWVGPAKQFKRMLQETRIVATIIFLAAMGITLYAAFFITNERLQRLLIIVGVVVQFCAYFWYSLTFIPFGRRIFKSLCKSCCAKCFEG